jgi:UDP-N-acetyl-D-mannosaminuronate dehydrogenase
MKIAIVGIGYLGLSDAVLSSQHNEVVAVDVDPYKVAMLKRWQSAIEDSMAASARHFFGPAEDGLEAEGSIERWATYNIAYFDKLLSGVQ